MAEPDPAILFPTLHLYAVDWADMSITIPVVGMAVVVGLVVGIRLRAIVARAKAVVLAGQEAVFLEPGQGGIGFLKQVTTILTTQGELADKAIWSDVLGVP